MRNTLDRIIIAVFAAILLAPALVFLIGGPAAEYEGTRQTPFPSFGSIISPKPDRREIFADALFERSWFRREAVRIKTESLLAFTGGVETDQVVSGAPGWFFLKEQFKVFDCAKHAQQRDRLRRFLLMAEFAETNSAPVIFAIAPNKASVERSSLAGRAARYAPCYDAFAEEWRAEVHSRGLSTIVDHADALADSAGGAKTYMRTDTHWTHLSGVRALAQLNKARPEALPPLPEITGEDPTPTATDLRNRMLGLKGREPERRPVFGPIDMERDYSRTLIVHDSFYARIQRYIREIAPGVRLIRFNQQHFRAADLKETDVLILESVERTFLVRAMLAEAYGWTSPAGAFLFNHAAKSSNAQCDWSRATNALAALRPQDVRRASLDGGTLTTTGGDPQAHLPPLATLGGPCVSIDIELPAPGALQIFISTEDAPERRFTEGASVIRRLPAGRHTVRFIMPMSARERALRFDPGPGPGARVAAFDLAPLN